MNNLKELRKLKGLRQIDIAKYFNIAESTYCCYEKGINEPDISTLLKLADFFGCTVDYLLGREDEQGTIFIMGNELSKSENKLLDMVRQLHEDDKDIVYKLVESILLSYKAKK